MTVDIRVESPKKEMMPPGEGFSSAAGIEKPLLFDIWRGSRYTRFAEKKR
jgi:hypothetical protein